MKHFDVIYELTVDSYGLVTAAEAKKAGVVGAELNRYVADGRLVRLGHGLYRLARYIPTKYDRYAEAVMQVGNGAFVFGESALAMHGLSPIDSEYITVATVRRVRKHLPSWLVMVNVTNGVPQTVYEGIPTQTVADALRTCKTSDRAIRLEVVVEDARNKGLLTEEEYEHFVITL